MEKLLICHAKPLTPRRDSERDVYGTEGPPLSRQDNRRQIPIIRQKIERYGMSIEGTVAVSRTRAARETAQQVGFDDMETYDVLNEPATLMSWKKLQQRAQICNLPEELERRGREMLDSPPSEKIWILGPLAIGGLCQILEVYEYSLLPVHGEARSLELPGV